MEEIEPNADELKAGWTKESLSEYVNERRAANDVALDWRRPRPKPQIQNGGLKFGGRIQRPTWQRS
jgi:hypothetical protein